MGSPNVAPSALNQNFTRQARINRDESRLTFRGESLSLTVDIDNPILALTSRQKDANLVLAGLAGTLKTVEVHCREARQKDPNYEPVYEVENHIRKDLRDFSSNLFVQIQSNRTSSRRFHDREVIVHIVMPDGCSEEHRFHLSGGIDYVMDTNSETKIFHYLIRD